MSSLAPCITAKTVLVYQDLVLFVEFALYGIIFLYDQQQEDAALTEQEKQERQQNAEADQVAMWESIGNVSPCTSGLKP